MVAGVYLITNKINGHMYVGGSVDINRRFKQHKRGIDIDSQAIDRAILKYGKENFSYQIITELPANWDTIGQHEKYWIKFYNTFENPKHYNLTEGGEGTSGWIPSEETRKKISKSLSGENHPNFGKKRSEETIKKMSESQKGEKNHNYGEKLSEKTKKKMSKSHSQKRNKTGYYRVSKKTNINCKKGFTYQYSYSINGKKHNLSSVSLEKLEKKVKNAGLPWKILDEKRARKTLNEVSS